MHDPLTLVWRLRIPYWREPKTVRLKSGEVVKRPYRGWRALHLAEVWHKDPETDGSDDSCSVRKRLTKRGSLSRQMLDHAGSDEARSPWFRRERRQEPSSPADAEALLRGGLWHVARCLKLDRRSIRHKRITFDDCARLASELLHNPIDNVRGSLCLLPGWHTNEPSMPDVDGYLGDPEFEAHLEHQKRLDPIHFPADTHPQKREELSQDFFLMLGKILSRESARWWQHPRWHIHHWQVRIVLGRHWWRAVVRNAWG